MSINAKLFSKHAATLALSALLVACGGGGSDPVAETVDPGAGTGGGGNTEIETSLTGYSGIADDACRTGRGEDADSSNDDWGDNCWIERDADGIAEEEEGLDFADSSYSQGIQRIVWCDGHVDGITLDDYDDGSFGPNTEMAVSLYQTDHFLVSDGVVGINTWTEFQTSSLTKMETRTNNIEQVDIDVYSISSDLPACQDQEAFYQRVEFDTSLGGWSMASEIGFEGETTFSNGF